MRRRREFLRREGWKTVTICVKNGVDLDRLTAFLATLEKPPETPADDRGLADHR